MTKGLAREGFDKDLLFGQARENAFIRTLMGKTFLEHKSDQLTRETGNFFIEYETSSEPDGFGTKTPSGISVTTAELWVTEFHDDCWVIMPTERMRTLARLVIGGKGKCVWAGDYNRFHGALVAWRWLLFPPSAPDDNGTGPHAEQLSL